MTNKEVMVYSIPRTGSTLIWQCLTKIFPKVLKSHRNRIWDYTAGIRISTEKHGAVLDYSYPCVITERDLMDSFFSQWRNDNWDSEALFYKWLRLASQRETFDIKKFKETCDAQIPLSSIRKTMVTFRRHLEDLEKVKKEYTGPLLVLQYERFWDDYDYIFTKFEEFFDMTILEEIKTEIKNTTNRNVNKSIQERLKGVDDHDTETHIHGGHIFLAEPGYSKKVLGEKNLERIQRLLRCDFEEIMDMDLGE